MRPPLRLVVIGIGALGRPFIERWLENPDAMADHFERRIVIAGLADSSGSLVSTKEKGFSRSLVRECLAHKSSTEKASISGFSHSESGDWRQLISSAHTHVFIDLSAADLVNEWKTALDTPAQHALVLANKKPLTGSLSDFRNLEASGRAAWEACVAAALPAVALQVQLQQRADRVVSIRGSVSGTLGFVTSQLAQGGRMWEILRKAVALGYCEPDPRSDLSGNRRRSKSTYFGSNGRI